MERKYSLCFLLSGNRAIWYIVNRISAMAFFCAGLGMLSVFIKLARR